MAQVQLFIDVYCFVLMTDRNAVIFKCFLSRHITMSDTDLLY